MIANPLQWRALPDPVCEWLSIQAERSEIPAAGEVLVETFPRGQRHFLVVYPFEGRLAHQTLGMLLTRRLLARARPAADPPGNAAGHAEGLHQHLTSCGNFGALRLDAEPFARGIGSARHCNGLAIMRRTRSARWVDREAPRRRRGWRGRDRWCG